MKYKIRRKFMVNTTLTIFFLSSFKSLFYLFFNFKLQKKNSLKKNIVVSLSQYEH
jgi:hypothetical protein